MRRYGGSELPTAVTGLSDPYPARADLVRSHGELPKDRTGHVLHFELLSVRLAGQAKNDFENQSKTLIT